MSRLLHLLRFDLQRLAPLIGLHALVLALGLWMLGRRGERIGGEQTWVVFQELLLVLVVGLLVTIERPGDRRSWAATRPVAWQTLYAEKLIFAMGFLWLPRGIGQLLRFHQLGLDGTPVFWWTALDFLTSETLWILVLFVLAFVTRSFAAYVVVVAVGGFVLRGVDQAFRSWIAHRSGSDPWELSLASCLYASLLVLVLLGALGDLFRRRNPSRMLLFLPALAAAALIPQPMASWLVHDFGLFTPSERPSVESLADLSLGLAPKSGSVGECNHQPFLGFGFEYEGLDPSLGLEVSVEEGEWRSHSGVSVPVDPGCRASACVASDSYTGTLQDAVLRLPLGPSLCSDRLWLMLFEQNDDLLALPEDEAGTLRLRLRVRALQERVQREQVQVGMTLEEGWGTTVLRGIELDREAAEVRLHFSRFSLQERSGLFNEGRVSRSPAYHLVYRETRAVPWMGGYSGSTAQERLLVPFSRLDFEHSTLVYSEQALERAGSKELSDFELSLAQLVYSEEKVLETEIEDFRLEVSERCCRKGDGG